MTTGRLSKISRSHVFKVSPYNRGRKSMHMVRGSAAGTNPLVLINKNRFLFRPRNKFFSDPSLTKLFMIKHYREIFLEKFTSKNRKIN